MWRLRAKTTLIDPYGSEDEGLRKADKECGSTILFGRGWDSNWRGVLSDSS